MGQGYEAAVWDHGGDDGAAVVGADGAAGSVGRVRR
jgi:hypothetical protein